MNTAWQRPRSNGLLLALNHYPTQRPDHKTDMRQYSNIEESDFSHLDASLPDSEELWPFSGSGTFALASQTAHVVDWQHRSGDEPRRPKQRADCNLDGDHQQVEVVPRTFLHTTAQSNNHLADYHYTDSHSVSLLTFSPDTVTWGQKHKLFVFWSTFTRLILI